MGSINELIDIRRKRSSLSGSSKKEPPPNINYKEEVILYFFDNMLDIVVDNWEGLGDIECLSSIPSGQNTCADSVEWICSAETDDEYIPVEAEIEEGILSFVKSTEEIEGYQKQRNSEEKESRKTKSKKSTRKRSSGNKDNTNNNEPVKKEESEEKNDDTWMIESANENVVIKFKNGNVYEGEVFRKLMHGFGKFTWSDGTIYTGAFYCGDITGEGKLHLPDGSCYEGGFLRGYRHGFGMMSIAETGSVYRGNWKSDMKHGRGWQLFEPNNWYDGQWENDAMCGVGIRQYPSGARYQGGWKRGKRCGKGIAVMKNNDFYVGHFLRGQKSGHGEYTWNAFYNKAFCVPVQSSYVGSWERNMRNGIGIMNFGMDGGARYAGCFDNNEKHGAGFVICDNGSTFEGQNLFRNDKPLHLKSTGSPISIPSSHSSEDKHSEEKNYGENQTESNDAGGSATVISRSYLARELSLLKIVAEKIHLPVHFSNSILANIELGRLAFPTYRESFHSLCIPINTPDDLIILNYYLKKIVESFGGSEASNTYEESKDHLSSFLSSKTFDVSHICCPDSSKKRLSFSPDRNSFLKDEHLTMDKKRQIDIEERNLRKAITTHLPKLRSIYKQYSTVACLKEVPFKTLLIRLFLWQLYRDCKLPEKGISLAQIDDLMMKNVDTELEAMHDPFEIIYFWQFLHSLIATAYQLYSKECMDYANEGILKSSFVKLLIEDIYPNHGHHKGCMLFDYVDVLPIRAAYKWFQEFNEPFTVLSFLQCSCTIKKSDPPDVNKKTDVAENCPLLMGINAYAIGHKLAYLQDEKPNIRTHPIPKEIKITDTEPFRKLFFLRKLGAKTVISILSTLCPTIINGKDIVNLQYEMTFYEFYEGVLLCIQEIINQENIEKIKERERQRIIDEENSPQTTEIFNRSIKSSRIKRGSKKKSHML